MKNSKKNTFKKYGFEFLSMFIAIIAAFALNNWNENRQANISENKILIEIANGLDKDILDIEGNMGGHKIGMRACNYFNDILDQKPVDKDSLSKFYFSITRDYISIQNTAGYETLKSRGLELIKNDSLRLQIISLYEYDYTSLKKLEEEYVEMQFLKSYFKEINNAFAPHIEFNGLEGITDIALPLELSNEEKNIIRSYLFKIKLNRAYIMGYYKQVVLKIDGLQKSIKKEIE